MDLEKIALNNFSVWSENSVEMLAPLFAEGDKTHLRDWDGEHFGKDKVVARPMGASSRRTRASASRL